MLRSSEAHSIYAYTCLSVYEIRHAEYYILEKYSLTMRIFQDLCYLSSLLWRESIWEISQISLTAYRSDESEYPCQLFRIHTTYKSGEKCSKSRCLTTRTLCSEGDKCLWILLRSLELCEKCLDPSISGSSEKCDDISK